MKIFALKTLALIFLCTFFNSCTTNKEEVDINPVDEPAYKYGALFDLYFQNLNEVEQPESLTKSDCAGMLMNAAYQLKINLEVSAAVNATSKNIEPFVNELSENIEVVVRTAGINEGLIPHLLVLENELDGYLDKKRLDDDGYQFLKDQIDYYNFLTKNEEALKFIKNHGSELLIGGDFSKGCSIFELLKISFLTAKCLSGNILACLKLVQASLCLFEDDEEAPCVRTVFDSDVCEGYSTTAGVYECDYYGGYYFEYNTGCGTEAICCFED